MISISYDGLKIIFFTSIIHFFQIVVNSQQRRIHMGKWPLVLSLCVSSIVFSLSSVPAHAAWTDNKIDEIIDDVKAVKTEVAEEGNVKVVADEFQSQIEELLEKGLILKESLEDFLNWLQTRERPYRDFVGSDFPRCVGDTVCAQFRIDLSNFFLEIGGLRHNFPIIEKSGLGNGRGAAYIVNNSPPIILFGLYEVLERVPDWQQIPEDLKKIFDEIGDPEVFSIRLDEEPTTTANTRFAQSSPVRSPSQQFCERWEKRVDNELDPVRLNRIEVFVFVLRQLMGLVESLTSETIGADLVGEGNETLIPNPLKAKLKMAVVVFNVIQKGAQTFRDNLGVCRSNRRELELQVAQCIELVDFILPSKRDAVYQLVQTKVTNAEAEHIPVEEAQKSLDEAERFRREGKFKQAYLKLCDSYRQIGD